MRVDFRFWQRWLLAVAVLCIVFGSVIALFSWSPLFSIFNGLVYDTFWPQSGPDAGSLSFMLWTYGMLGGTMAGWGVFIAYLARHPFANKEHWAWECLAIGIAVWFLIDTAVSIFINAYFNVAINVLLLLLVAAPLLATKDLFSKFQMKSQ